jgi:hypothetical protein
MRTRRPGLAAVLAAGVLAAGVLAAGCAGSNDGPPSATASTDSPSPRPTVTTTLSTRTLAAGATTDFTAQAGVSLRLSASKPRVSTSRLSSSYGHPPAHGYYVTFTLTIVNTGTRPVDLGPPNFHVRIPKEGVVTAYDGNAPYSGAPTQLDNTELAPGERVRAPLTFDVRRPHGVLMYLPDRSAAVTWTF